MVHTMCEFENQRCVDPMKPSGKQLIKNRFELIQFPTFFLKYLYNRNHSYFFVKLLFHNEFNEF